ncbi:DUF2887 domain-containing protein [Pseudanabaena minima]|uniref:DUF2887 domain-containing protein n=1 Tax=Pseudanabaena minima TaxID=890415 RepID=UPI003DAA1080
MTKYLDELPEAESCSLGLVRLIVAPQKETIALAHQLAERVGQGDRERVVEFIGTVLLYKFPQMSRDEVEAMFTLGYLKKTRGKTFAPQFLKPATISICKCSALYAFTDKLSLRCEV